MKEGNRRRNVAGTAKAIFQTASGLTVGRALLGERGGVTGSVRQEVHDGDTVNVRADGNFGVRLLGADAPEISFTLPGRETFTGLGDPLWETFLSHPLGDGFGASLDPGLLQHLEGRVGPGTAANHYRHARRAEDRLEEEVFADLAELGQDPAEFRFFLAFAQDVIDRYGRFLCYLNRDQPGPGRPPTYNERLLADGSITPYFIWPNTQPFMKQPTLRDAVVPTGQARVVGESGRLGEARHAVKAARQRGDGLYDAVDPLRLQPFELRFLARRQPPDRWVVDLGSDGDTLLAPQAYHTVANPEDRLFVPDAFVALFREAGWR